MGGRNQPPNGAPPSSLSNLARLAGGRRIVFDSWEEVICRHSTTGSQLKETTFAPVINSHRRLDLHSSMRLTASTIRHGLIVSSPRVGYSERGSYSAHQFL